MNFDKELDARGLNCPLPILRAKKALGDMSSGQVLDELLARAEAILEEWVRSRGTVPTVETSEGFRLLALHRQGARGVPSFNACRETCREIAYHYNVLGIEPDHPQAAHRARMMALLVEHLKLFVRGKLEVEGLGEFCCSSRPLRLESAAEKRNEGAPHA